jgi:transposase
VRTYQRGGWETVAVQSHCGPPKGSGCLLSAAQQQAIRNLINEHTPDQLDLPFALLSRPAVTALIEMEYGMTLPVRTVGRYLQRWSFTPQKPLDRAYEPNPARVQAWVHEEYPAIAPRQGRKRRKILGQRNRLARSRHRRAARKN